MTMNALERIKIRSNNLFDLIYGYDYFISYAWKDGRKYAHSLANLLREKGYTVFLDRDQFEVGSLWRKDVIKILKKSSKAILVATNDAVSSEAVDLEMEIASKNSIPVIPIRILTTAPDNALDNIKKFLSEDIIFIPEAVVRVSPSENTTNTLQNTFLIITQYKKRLRIFVSTIVSVIVLIFSIVLLGVLANNSVQKANFNQASKLASLSESVRQSDNHEDASKLALVSLDLFENSGINPDGALAALTKVVSEYHAVAVHKNENNEVTSIATFPDFDRLAIGYANGLIQILDLKMNHVDLEIQAHEGRIGPMSVSDDGSFLISSDYGNVPLVWNTKNGQKIHSLVGHEVGVSHVSTTGEKIITASLQPIFGQDTAKFVASIWDLKSGDHLNYLFNSKNGIGKLQIDQNGKYAAIASSGTVTIQSLSDKNDNSELGIDGEWIYAGAFSSDGKYIITASSKKIRVWDADSKKMVSQKEISHDQFDIVISPDSTQFATTSLTGTPEIWSIPRLDKLYELSNSKGRAGLFIFSNTGRWIVTGNLLGSSALSIWSSRNGRFIGEFTGIGDSISQFVFDQDDTNLVVGYRNGMVVQWNMNLLPFREFPNTRQQSLFASALSRSGERYSLSYVNTLVQTVTHVEVHTTDGSLPPVSLKNYIDITDHLVFSVDGNRLVTVSRSGSVAIWNAVTGDRLFNSATVLGEVETVSISDDARFIFAVTKAGELKVVDSTNNTISKDFKDPGGNNVRYVIWCSCGDRILTTSETNTHTLWDFKSKSILKTWQEEFADPIGISFSNDGKYIFKSDAALKLLILNAENGDEIKSLVGFEGIPSSITESPDGELLAISTSEAELEVWNWKKSSRVMKFIEPGPTKINHAFSENSRHLITSTFFDDVLDLWDIESGQKLKTLFGGSAAMNHAILKNDTIYAVQSKHKGINLWKIEQFVRPVIDIACSKLSTFETGTLNRKYNIDVDTEICQ